MSYSGIAADAVNMGFQLTFCSIFALARKNGHFRGKRPENGAFWDLVCEPLGFSGFDLGKEILDFWPNFKKLPKMAKKRGNTEAGKGKMTGEYTWQGCEKGIFRKNRERILDF